MTSQPCLIAYDIQDDNARKAALYLLRKSAISYQDSVFEIQLPLSHHQQ